MDKTKKQMLAKIREYGWYRLHYIQTMKSYIRETREMSIYNLKTISFHHNKYTEYKKIYKSYIKWLKLTKYIDWSDKYV